MSILSFLLNRAGARATFNLRTVTADPRRSYVPLILTIAIAASAAARPQQQPDEEPRGITGSVLAPDGSPVPIGTVAFRGLGGETSTSIGPDGRFHLVPHAAASHQVYVSVPGFAVHRINVLVPPSKTFTFPPIRLPSPSYFRVRGMSPAREPIGSPFILRQSFDVNGMPLSEGPAARAADQFDSDGAVTIGPLPRGITTMALDIQPFARTRLPDVRITSGSAIVDGAMVMLEPGAVLHVDVVDGEGAPVPAHEVRIEDALPFSPLFFSPARTDENGRATFERLASGRYRLRTRTVEPCGRQFLTISRSVRVSGSGTLRTRLVIGGRATFRLMSSGVPLRATSLSVTAESAPAVRPPWLRTSILSPFVGRPFGPYSLDSPCNGVTDADGRVTLAEFPPGPARVDVRLPHSTWVGRVSVPPDGREVALDIPSGFMSVRVSNAATKAPLAGAAITWTSGGARVETTTSATGDALMGAVAAAPGTLTVRAPRFRSADVKLPAPPEVLHEVALVPARDSVQARVVAESGDPVAAVVELVPDDPIETAYVATTDSKGSVRFFDLPPGSLRLVTHADGYVTSVTRIPANATDDVVVTLRLKATDYGLQATGYGNAAAPAVRQP